MQEGKLETVVVQFTPVHSREPDAPNNNPQQRHQPVKYFRRAGIGGLNLPSFQCPILPRTTVAKASNWLITKFRVV